LLRVGKNNVTKDSLEADDNSLSRLLFEHAHNRRAAHHCHRFRRKPPTIFRNRTEAAF
jgi:hypothetical protein